MNTADLKILRNNLPKKWAPEIALRTKKTRVYVWQVLNGHAYNAEIIDAAIQLAKEEKAVRQARVMEIANL